MPMLPPPPETSTPQGSWRWRRGSSMIPSGKYNGGPSARVTSSSTGVGSVNGGSHILYARDSVVLSWSSTTSLSARPFESTLIGAAPPHRFALHRRRRCSSAPLLLIASLCIVAGSAHRRRSSSSLRSASSPALLIGAAPPHRFALHRRRRDSCRHVLVEQGSRGESADLQRLGAIA